MSDTEATKRRATARHVDRVPTLRAYPKRGLTLGCLKFGIALDLAVVSFAPQVDVQGGACQPQRGSTSQPRVAQRTLGMRHPASTNPNGVQPGDLCNPCGVGVMVLRTNPGCAARPRALMFDRVAVLRLSLSGFNLAPRKTWQYRVFDSPV